MSLGSISRDHPFLVTVTCIPRSTDFRRMSPSFNRCDDMPQLAGSVLSDFLLSVELDPGLLAWLYFVVTFVE